MKGITVALGLFLGASSDGQSEPARAGPVLVLPGAKESTRLRLDVTVDGQPPSAAWEAFLDRFFDWFDRDGDGWLSQAETARMVRLPLPGRQELTIDFGKLDADGDGKGSRAELKAFCRRHGFGPLVVVLEPPSADDRRLSELFLRRLDADGDGKITKEEWRKANHALHKYDLNEDEFLDRSELLAAAAPVSAPGEIRLKLAETADAALRLDVGAKAPSATLEAKGTLSVRLVAPGTPGGLHRLYGPQGRWLTSFRATRAAPDVRSAGEFLASQFKTALGDRAALTQADLEQDPSLSGLLGLFRYSDRNADGRLSAAELEEYLRLVGSGVASQVWITATDRAHNPFPVLDADGDGRLSYRELSRAGDLLAGDAGANGLPAQFQISFGGPTAAAWGGVPIPAVFRRPRPGTSDAPKLPRWFLAMDRNGDGIVSPREFVGPPEVFRKLDTDGDGVISAEEAARAGDR
jgi:Ca2+-binding EF-hand superfamily protein